MESAVTNADLRQFDQVFGYQGLYVADCSILPTAVGADPCATTSTMTELVAHDITGRDSPFPDSDL